MKLTEAIEKRRSIRKFGSAKVKFGAIFEAIDAAIQAPFAGNQNTLRFIIVQNPETIKQLAICCQQDFVNNATFVIVVCSDLTKIRNLYHDRADKYAKQHAGAAIQNFLLRITDLKLGSCWIGAFTDEKIKSILGIPEKIDVEALLPVGYIKPGSIVKAPRKEAMENLIRWETWKQMKRPKSLKEPRTW